MVKVCHKARFPYMVWVRGIFCLTFFFFYAPIVFVEKVHPLPKYRKIVHYVFTKKINNFPIHKNLILPFSRMFRMYGNGVYFSFWIPCSCVLGITVIPIILRRINLHIPENRGPSFLANGVVYDIPSLHGNLSGHTDFD